MSDKPPAFQWYPKDHLADEKVVLMSLEEEGAYFHLTCYCWLEGSIPTDAALLARLCGVDEAKMRELLPAITPCFQERGERYVHPRLDLERKKYATHSEAKSRAGKEGAKARWQKEKNGCALELPLAENSSSSSTSSSITDICTFEDFWKAYPKRKGSNPKRPAQEKWKTAVKQITPEALLEAVKSFAQRCRTNGDTGTPYVPMAQTWLNQARWEEEADGVDSRGDEVSGALDRPSIRDWSPEQ